MMPLNTLGAIIDDNAARRGDRTAFVYDGETVSFAALADHARRFGSGLYGLGLRRQDRVAVLGENGLALMQVYAACELAGFIAVPVNFRLAVPEILHVLTDSAPSLLVFEPSFRASVEQLRPQLPSNLRYACTGDRPDWVFDTTELVRSGSRDGPPIRAKAEELAFLIYTSGTTGRPKGCMLDHRGQVAKTRQFGGSMGCTPDDRMLLTMPLFHVGAKALQMAQHASGGAVHIQRGFDPAAVLAEMVQARITIGHMAPTMVQTFLDTPDVATADLSALRTILYSGAPMPLPLLRRGLALLGPIFRQSYGQTEGSATALLPAEHDISGDPAGLRRLGSVGRPFEGVELRIAGEDDDELPTGTPGEVLVRTASAMVGYWNNSAATIEALRGGWLHTGDIGKVDEDGFLTLVDRKKDVIISGGENIYSREVEDALGSHPDVAAVAVIGIPDPYWGETVCAVVVPNPAATPTLASLEAHSRSRIASYKRLRWLELVEDLPYLATGKVDKKALRARYIPVK